MSGELRATGADKDDFRMYYDLQYRRMGELENQRLTMSNLIVSVSVLAFGLAFDDLSNINIVNGVALPIAVLLINILAAIYVARSREFIKVHQMRAREALKMFAPELLAITTSLVEKRDSDKDFFRRPRIQTYLHIVLVVVALVPIAIFYHVI